VYGWLKSLVFSPALNCPHKMEVEWSWAGKAFQTVGTATWKFRWSNSVLVHGTNMSLLTAKQRLNRPAISTT